MTQDTQMDMGKTYKVTYKQQSGNHRWYKWEMTATVLGNSRGEILFNLRPLAGTTRIPGENILAFREAGYHEHVMPKRFPGAIET